MRKIQNADYSGTSNTLDYYAELIDTVRSVANTPIVIGGSGFSVMPAELMARLRPDYGISGEAEEAFPALLDCLDRDGLDRAASLDGIGNLHRFEDGELVSNGPPSSFLDLNTLSPADPALVDSRVSERLGLEAPQTKQRCPLLRRYCT